MMTARDLFGIPLLLDDSDFFGEKVDKWANLAYISMFKKSKEKEKEKEKENEEKEKEKEKE